MVGSRRRSWVEVSEKSGIGKGYCDRGGIVESKEPRMNEPTPKGGTDVLSGLIGPFSGRQIARREVGLLGKWFMISKIFQRYSDFQGYQWITTYGRLFKWFQISKTF